METDPSRRDLLKAGAATFLTMTPIQLFAQSSAPSSAAADDTRLIPMPGRVTNASALLHVTGKAPAGMRARVRWGRDADEVESSPRFSASVEASGAPLRLELPVTGLSADQKVHYRIEVAQPGASELWRPSAADGVFYTQKPPGKSFRFCVMSDAHWNEEDNVPAAGARRWMGEQIVAQMAVDGPYDFCLELGDAAQLTHLKSPGDAMNHYLIYRKIIAPLTRVMPVFMALGNHEREAGFFQRGADLEGKISNYQTKTEFNQRWATNARLEFIPNPRGDTYPEGGEGAPGFDTSAEWIGDKGPWNAGAPTHLGNFYAWSWGDALFIVLDPYRYTLVGSPVLPSAVQQWTLGKTQMAWLKKTLSESKARWKIICSHHQVGGGAINGVGEKVVYGDQDRAYGRGSAIEARNPETEQSKIHALMREHGAQFFLYGHDHAFCHSVLDDVHYICCARPTHLNNWWKEEGMLESYGDLLSAKPTKEWIRAIRNVLGYARFEVSPERLVMQWVKAGYSFVKDGSAPADARRDWLEVYCGKTYDVGANGQVEFSAIPFDVDGAYKESEAAIKQFRKAPTGINYYTQPTPQRPERYTSREIALTNFPESRVVVDAIPEVVYEFALDA